MPLCLPLFATRFARRQAKPAKLDEVGKGAAEKELIEMLGGLDKFLDAGDKAIMKAWDAKYKPKPPPAEKKEPAAAKKE